MKQYQINKAYEALTRLSSARLPIKDAYNIYMLIEKLKPGYLFTIEREKGLIDKYHGIFDGETGDLNFKDRANAEAFRDEVAQLNDLDSDIEFSPVELGMEALDGVTIAPADMMFLQDFVTFR